ncbi:nuclear transport factor 2 family protein [Streptomyces sp. NPDC087420]|uniref:nuclear transport factor 2 family protein n=1 Tax=Streptomyces sp. NPDC087420 TaxID=3365785 RepID=UPI0038390C09
MPASPPHPEPSAPRSARPGGAPPDLVAVWAVITDMYESYTAGDRARIDSYLDPEATIWDSATSELLLGKAELDRVRDTRPTSDEGPTESALTAYGQVIDIFEDLAVARYWLRVDFYTAPSVQARNTAVLQRTRPDGPWLIVHLHEDIDGTP